MKHSGKNHREDDDRALKRPRVETSSDEEPKLAKRKTQTVDASGLYLETVCLSFLANRLD
jgi:hypothetical protein